MNIKAGARQTSETVARDLHTVKVVMSASIKKNNDKSESEKEIELVSLTHTPLLSFNMKINKNT